MTIRPIVTRTITAAALFALVACGDSRLTKLTVGMPKDSALAVMKVPAHRTASYLLGGVTWDFEVFPMAQTDPKDSVAWRTMSPVAMIDGKVVGWGWGWWDKESGKLGIGLVPAAPTK